MAKIFEFSSDLIAREFSLEVLKCEKERALSLCISESGKSVAVSIGFVKLNTSAANLLAEEIDGYYQETNEIR